MPDPVRNAARHSRSSSPRLRQALVAFCFVLGVFALGSGLMLPAFVSAQSEPTPLPLYALPDPRLSTASSTNMLALARDNVTLVAANMLNNTISVYSVSRSSLVAEIPVGSDPRSVALTEDGALAVTANRGDGTLSVVELASGRMTSIRLDGVLPYGVLIAPDNRTAYVSLQGSGKIAVVDLIAGQAIRYIGVPAFPSGMALWGDFLYVTHFWTGQVSLIYLPLDRLIDSVSTGFDTGLSQSVELDITRGLAYLPQTRSNAQNAHLTFDTTVFPVINVMDLRNLTVSRPRRIAIDTADRPINMPFAAALDRFRNWLYVANAGSDNISIIDLNTGLARANLAVGSNPRGILLNRDNSILYVYNALDGTLSVIDTRNLRVVTEIPISDFTIPVDVILASQLFYSAADPRLSTDSWISCANCHFDGASDGRVWRGFPDGPRNTPVLFGLLETAPYNASATWDELADVELKIRSIQAGLGLLSGPVNPALGDPHAARSLDLDVLSSYLATLSGPIRPASSDAALVERGRVIFNQQQCADCHVGTAGTDLQTHDVGTGDAPGERAGSAFDTPSLRWLWLSAPYFHDGSASSLRDVFTLPGAHQLVRRVSPTDLDALVAYLLTLPTS